MKRSATACDVSIVMPCLNEAETIEHCVIQARAALDDHQLHGEVVVGDNGSTDGSIELARGAGARVVNVPEKGYGAALMGGIEAARGRWIIIGDSDGSHDFGEIDRFVTRLRDGYDLVMGTRLKGTIVPGAMAWKNRYIGVPVLMAAMKLFFRSPCSDAHCGMRGFTAEAYRRMGLRTTGMEFASEMPIKATLLGLKMTEVPITMHPSGRSRAPHLRPWRDGWRHLRFMLLYSPNWVFLIPGVLMMLLGGGLMAAVFLVPLLLGRSVVGAHTMVWGSLMMILGYQAVGCGLLARTFAITERLLPPRPGMEWLYRRLSLEAGLVTGALLSLLGVALTLGVLWRWVGSGFDRLPYSVTLPRAILGATLIVLGVQTIFASFFASLLGLRRRQQQRLAARNRRSRQRLKA